MESRVKVGSINPPAKEDESGPLVFVSKVNLLGSSLSPQAGRWPAQAALPIRELKPQGRTLGQRSPPPTGSNGLWQVHGYNQRANVYRATGLDGDPKPYGRTLAERETIQRMKALRRGRHSYEQIAAARDSEGLRHCGEPHPAGTGAGLTGLTSSKLKPQKRH
jgi:hypothetical protein